VSLADELAQRIDARRHGAEYKALCPAHDDHTPSLGFRDGDRAELVVHCYAGCAQTDVLAALRDKYRDIFPAPHGNNGRVVVATYTYENEDGTPLYDVVRFARKDFRQRKADGAWNMDGVRRVPFHLPRLIEAAKAGGTVYVVEGEKDVLNLERIGLTATTNPGGAGKWRREYSEYFKGVALAVILCDNDEPGRKHGADVARSVRTAGVPVSVVTLPDLPEKGDVSDWLARGGTRDDLLALVSASTSDEGGDPSDCPRCGKDSCAGACNVAESLPAFLARARNKPEPGWFIRELIPDEGVVIWHGRPRSMKSLTAEDAMLSLALGESYALHNPRFAIAAPTGILWLGEEDPERLDAFRLAHMLKARGVDAPETFRLVVRPGWDLETDLGQAELLATIRDTSAAMTTPLRVLVIDPARASLPSIDGSPKDAAPARAFLLRILRETSISVIVLPHHDTKPRTGADARDNRLRAERAAGGVTFSMGDCMVNFERVSDRECIATPTAYKVGADPKPFRVRFESETPSGQGFQGYIRAVADTDDESATMPNLDANRDRGVEKMLPDVLSYLRRVTKNGASKRAVRDNVHGTNGWKDDALGKLVGEGHAVLRNGRYYHRDYDPEAAA
jgi:hypothetical protein